MESSNILQLKLVFTVYSEQWGHLTSKEVQLKSRGDRNEAGSRDARSRLSVVESRENRGEWDGKKE